MSLILASASPRRLELLRLIGIEPRVVIPDINEEQRENEPVDPFLKRVTIEKGLAVYCRQFHSLPIVSADTIVLVDGRVIGKPVDRDHARRMLMDLSGRDHQVRTGLALMYRGQTHFAVACTEVRFRFLEAAEIERYLDHDTYRDKAGAYAIQGRAAVFVERIEGCYFNVMGFPLNLFDRMLRQHRIPAYD